MNPAISVSYIPLYLQSLFHIKLCNKEFK